jgi:hypothetical protein
MRAWHGDPELKERVVERMRQHRAADAFIQGSYQQLDIELPLGYRGCAIGCLLDKRPELIADLISDDADDNRWHAAVQHEFGIPFDLAEQIDQTFEYFTDGEDPHGRASDFAVAVVEAIPVGADLSGVATAFDDWWYDFDATGWTDQQYEDARAAKLIEMVARAVTP